MKFPAFEPIDLKNKSHSFEVIDLDWSQIMPNENQPRKNFCENALEEMAASIRQHGIIQPIIVKDIGNNKKYQIVAGERRWRAARIAGLEKIPAIIRGSDKPDRIAVSLIENIQRENLNPLEEAQAIQSLLEECHMTHNQIAESIGKSRATVTNLLRLLTLTDQLKAMINSRQLEMGHARALLCLSREQQIEIAAIIVNKSLSVRETEKLVQRINIPHKEDKFFITLEFEKQVKEWEKHLSRQFSSKTNLYFNPAGKGRIVINFDSVEEAKWLIQNIVVKDTQKINEQ